MWKSSAGEVAESAAKIRTYRPTDRLAVRQLSCDTADRGEPVDRLFHDCEAVADVLVRGYMDFEPQFLWVAECEDQVAGYLTGCLDTRAFDGLLEKKVIPKAVWRSIARGALLHLQTWHLLGAFAATALLGGFPHRIDLNAYPAHFHVNLGRRFRGHGLGRQLVDAFRRQVDLAGIGGIHVVARGDNPGGRKFFEAMDFKRLFEQPLILPQGRWFKRVSTIVYGWRRED
jgi:GNAT superfamily N-acetyltransferase